MGILIKAEIKHKQVPCKHYTSFEHVMVSSKLSSGDKVFLVTVYRLDYISTSIFYQEFTQLLEELCVMKGNFIMSGDINFHLETMDANVVTLKNIFESFNLVQHVNLPTHSKGHTLDFILCRDDMPKISSLKVEVEV